MEKANMSYDNLFVLLEKINTKPKPYQYYTTPEFWCDPYIAKQMLTYHLAENEELASRKKDFIERSVQWITDYCKINAQSRIGDFGCGPGLYTTRFAEKGALVTGIDFSANSINYARAHAKRKKMKIEYVLQNYLTFTTDKKFDLITMIYCDFCVLSPKQRKTLLKKFYNYLKDSGSILLDVSSFAEFGWRSEGRTSEYSSGNGFWSAEPYFVFHNCFKYKKDHILLDKYTIVEKTRIRIIYNWLQCYSLQSISKELRENGFEVVDYYANVAGDLYKKSSREIAVIAKKIGV
jgi:cyclopropane fatty-acyl-phospholipid synthase-like methyltransferase